MKFSGRHTTLILFLLFFSLFGSFSFSQYWLTHHYSETEGLATSFVNDIVQDNSGRMWLATRDGISCYDGVNWEHHDESNGLPDYSFIKIRISRDGKIWAVAKPDRSSELPVFFFDGSKWHQIETATGDFPKGDEITSFQLIDHNKETILFVGTIDSGIYRWQKGKWRNLTFNDGLWSNIVNGLAVLYGKCYAATDKGLSVIGRDGTIDNKTAGMIKFPPGKTVSANGKELGSSIKGIYIDKNGQNPRIWLFGDGYLGYFYGGDYKTVSYHIGMILNEKEKPVRLLPDDCGGVYIGNIYELFYFNCNTRQTQRLSVTNGLIGVGVNTMLRDFEKNIWFSCDRGVTKISSRRFGSFSMVHGLLEDEVTAVLEYEPGKFVLGHNTGLTFYDGRRFEKLPFFPGSKKPPRLCRVLEMKADSKQNIWIAASHMGLAKVNKRKEITWYGSEHGLPDKITSIWVDSRDNLWLGTIRGLFRRHNDGRISQEKGQVSNCTLRRIFGEKGKLRYLATHESGLFVYDEEKGWQRYRSGSDKKANGVYAIKKDSSGRLLVGSAGGLYVLEEGLLKKLKLGNFEINRPVYFINQDRQQRLWFGTDNGVVRWDGSREIRYSIPEGLIGQETNRAAGITDSRGRVWIGSNRGVSIYDDAFDNYNSWIPAPKLRLLGLSTGDRQFPLDRPVELNYDTHRMIFFFKGISFLDERAIRFKHKLEGFDREWSEEQYHYYQMVEYTNPRPGRYRFLLKVKNSMGIWSDIVSSPEIVVTGPFYNAWWFYLLLLLGVGLLFYVLFNFITSKRNAAILERLVDERTGQLQASERRYRELFEETHDMVFITSTDGKILDINPAGISLLGFSSKSDALGVDIETDLYVNPKDRSTYINEIKQKGFVEEYEINLKRKDGEKISVLVTASLVTDEEQGIDLIRGILRDITEKKKLQQQLEQSQKMEAIGTLAGGIAHDFNNILGVIGGYLDLTVTELEEGTAVRKNIDRVIASTNRAKDLVKQILTFSRRDSRDIRPLRISLIVKEALKLLRSTLPATIEIRQDIKAETGIVLAEPTQIHQVMMNLCTNAAHAMRESGGVLEVKLAEVELDEDSAAGYNDAAPGRYLRLTVSDTGHGIVPDIIKRIFDPYFTTKNPGEGTGMGLAVIHGIVKSLDGEITVSSEPGSGTTFHVILPASRDAEETYDVEGLKEESDVPRGKNERILLVDDEYLLVNVGQRLLEMIGYRVATATNGFEALAAFQEEPGEFDIVITDFTMPRMTGVQLSKKLLDIRPDIPIILCTGFSESVTADQAIKLGIRKLLFKPIDRDTMAHAIRDVLSGKK